MEQLADFPDIGENCTNGSKIRLKLQNLSQNSEILNKMLLKCLPWCRESCICLLLSAPLAILVTGGNDGNRDVDDDMK